MSMHASRHHLARQLGRARSRSSADVPPLSFDKELCVRYAAGSALHEQNEISISCICEFVERVLATASFTLSVISFRASDDIHPSTKSGLLAWPKAGGHTTETTTSPSCSTRFPGTSLKSSSYASSPRVTTASARASAERAAASVFLNSVSTDS